MIDRKDGEILNLLQKNSHLSNVQLSEQTNLSPSSCWRRIKALEDLGVIERYSVVVNPKKMGLNFEAIVHLGLDRHDSSGVEKLAKLLDRSPEVIECYATTGIADFHMRVLCQDIEAYNKFLENVLFQNSSIRSAQTNVVLKRIKNGTPIAAT